MPFDPTPSTPLTIVPRLTFAECVAAIVAVPCYRPNARHWAPHVETVAAVAAYIIGSDDFRKALYALAADAETHPETLIHFTHGNTASGKPWPELRQVLAGAGVQIVTAKRLPGTTKVAPTPPMKPAPGACNAAIKECVRLYQQIPNAVGAGGKRRGLTAWATHVGLVAEIVAAIQRSPDPVKTRNAFARRVKINPYLIHTFTRGLSSTCAPWNELRVRLAGLGVTREPTTAEAREGDTSAAQPVVVPAPAPVTKPEAPVDARTPEEAALDEAAALFAAIPEAVGRCNWRAHPDLVAQGLAALHRAGNTLLNRALLAERGVPISRLDDALRGNWHDRPWPELRKAMADLGVPRPESQLERSNRLIREQHAAHEAPRPDPVPAFKVTCPEPEPLVGPFKPAALVVRDGVVALVDAPAPTPAAMVAKPGDYARKTEAPPAPPTVISSQTTKSVKTDPDSGDLVLTTTVVTVTRVAYGTPEHLALSKARAATCAAKSAA